MQIGRVSVKINLQTEIKDATDRQQTTIKAVGELFQTERQTVIRFIEKIADQAEVNVMITIRPDQVTVKRSGGVKLNQIFQPDKITEATYRHSYGSIRIETFTEALFYKPLKNNEKAELTIDYTTKLNEDEKERKHKLKLLIEEDKS